MKKIKSFKSIAALLLCIATMASVAGCEKHLGLGGYDDSAVVGLV